MKMFIYRLMEALLTCFRFKQLTKYLKDTYAISSYLKHNMVKMVKKKITVKS